MCRAPQPADRPGVTEAGVSGPHGRADFREPEWIKVGSPSASALADQDAELAAGALPPLDPPDEDEDDPDDDEPDDEDEPDEDELDEDPEDEDEPDDPESPPEDDDSDLPGLLVVPPAVASEPDARESVR
ncbi:hypothetical protein [Micromonospora sp. NPDC023888]|uniref:hypothetical protein n=1 Tax=Micromonospora sp. NPDC023888 TaxID=3155607 RepID=UPI0033C98FF1